METKPALEATLVQEFVGNAHGNFARVKEMLEQEPALVNATWDWGGGDFETALGAASLWAANKSPIIYSSTAPGWIFLPPPCSANWK